MTISFMSIHIKGIAISYGIKDSLKLKRFILILSQNIANF